MQHAQERNETMYLLNYQRIAVRGCHLAKSRLPMTPSSFQITVTTLHIHTFVVLQHNAKRDCRYLSKRILRRHQVCTTKH